MLYIQCLDFLSGHIKNMQTFRQGNMKSPYWPTFQSSFVVLAVSAQNIILLLDLMF